MKSKYTLSASIIIYLLCTKFKFLAAKRIVITGGPGSGKTAVIKYLEERGYAVQHEISRQVTLKAQEDGIAQLFLENPILFSQKLLEGRIEQYKAASQMTDMVFYDRGMADVTAYLDFVKVHYPDNFVEECQTKRYDVVFVLPPWEKIYVPDNERYETFEQAERIFHHLKDGYRKYGYSLYEVPVGTVEQRTQFILDTLKKII